MRIGQLMAGAAQGGAELFFERLTAAFHQAGDDVLPLIRPEAGRMARLRGMGLEPIGLRYGGPLDLLTRPRLARALAAGHTEVAIAWMSRAAFHAPRGPWRLVGRLGGYYPLKYFRRCDHLVGNTRDIVRWVAAQGWPDDRITYLPNFVSDFRDVLPVTRTSLDLPHDVSLVLGLGRLHRVKGFDVLIRAMRDLPRAHLVIAGEGPERPALRALIAELNLTQRVHLLGWRTDSGALLRAADVFVSSSRHEPLGNMVLEAFSAGVPVVAAAAEGPREVINDGQDGLLVPTNDARALAAGIADSLNGRGSHRAAAGRARFETEFTQPVVVAAWRDYLARIMR